VTLAPPDRGELRRAVAAALDEDLRVEGDVTSRAVLDAGASCRSVIEARERLVLAGAPVLREVFEELGRRGYAPVSVRELAGEGDELAPGAVVFRVEGDAAAVLAGERTGLNYLQRLSGIATFTRRCVAEVEGTGVAILDTRKTTPGLRFLEKYAVAVGGGTNHRTGLYDRVLIKDNHLALSGGIRRAVERARAAGHPRERVEVEIESPAGVEEAVAAGAGWILLDNFEPEELREAVRLCAGRARLEASGGLRPGDLRRFAETGVDALSLGALTHSAPAADLALEMEPAGRSGDAPG
jgi:nicotinate-nucleotide pyrophosphorylase (carboxylating)